LLLLVVAVVAGLAAVAVAVALVVIGRQLDLPLLWALQLQSLFGLGALSLQVPILLAETTEAILFLAQLHLWVVDMGHLPTAQQIMEVPEAMGVLVEVAHKETTPLLEVLALQGKAITVVMVG